MNRRVLMILALMLPFGGLTLYALSEVGYVGIFKSVMVNAGSWQVLVDLVIACVLACTWMLVDARRRGTNAWPFVILTLGGGSFGPLLYLLFREWGRDSTTGEAQPTGA